MIKIIALLFALTLNVAVAQEGKVKGTLPPSLSGRTLVLTLMNYETRKDQQVKEIKMDKNGAFAFSIPLTEAAIFNLSAGDSSLLHMLIKPNDNIDLTVRKDAIVAKGSVDTQYLINYEAHRKILFQKWLKPAYDSAAVAEKSGDKKRIEYWNMQHEKASENYKAELGQWVRQPFFLNSLASVHHTLRWHSDHDIELMDAMAAALQKNYPKAELTRQLVAKVNSAKRIAIGATAPEFQLKNLEGNTVDLKSYRGKYTLVDFWASWCGPCRQESPTLVRLYNSFKDSGFEILTVSIDTDETKWKNAIKKDGFTWQSVSELSGYAGPTSALYNISAIPSSFLLDKDGKIVAKNLRGKDLEKMLGELTGK
ncbi:MAG: TlpA disulfide reductase family protein [Bacteroidota bacterium]